MDEDVKNTETSESEEETSTSEAEEKTVPYSRFKEVNDKMRVLEGEINSLKSQGEKGVLSAEQEKELQAKQYLKTLLKETLEEDKKAETETKAKELKEFESEVKDVLELYPDVKKDEFLKFVEEKSEHYGIQSVSGAMKLYRDLNNLSKEVSEKTKKEILNKPKTLSHEGAGGTEKSDIAGKSLWQIAEEAIRELKK